MNKQIDSELYAIIDSIYSRWTGQEVADVIAAWRRDQAQRQEEQAQRQLFNELKEKFSNED